jgi:hypothetical protein
MKFNKNNYTLLTLLKAIFLLQRQTMVIHCSIYDVDSSDTSSEKESCHRHTGNRSGH